MNTTSRTALQPDLNEQVMDNPGEVELRRLGDLMRAVIRGIPGIFIVSFVVGVLAFLSTFMSDPKYTSIAKVMIDTRVSTETEFTTQVSGLPISLTSLESELEVLRSTDLVEDVVNRLSLIKDTEFSPVDDEGRVDSDMTLSMVEEATIDAVLDARTVEQIGAASAVYAIQFTSLDPNKAADIANALAEEYLQFQTLAKQESLAQSQGWLATRITGLQVDLENLSSRLEAHAISQPFSSDEYATIKARRITNERSASGMRQELAELKVSLDTFQQFVTSGAIDAAIKTATDAGMTGVDADATELSDVEITEITEQFQTRIDAVSTRLDPLEAVIERLTAQQSIQVQHEAQQRRIENEIAVTEAIYQDFVAQLSRRTEQDDYLDADARIIERARPSTEKSEPKRGSTGLMAFILAAVGSTLFVILRELFQNKLRTPTEYEEVTGLRLAGLMPEVSPAVAPLEHFFSSDRELTVQLMQFGRKVKSRIDMRLAKSGAFAPAEQSTIYQPTGTTENGPKFPDRSKIIAGASAHYAEGQTSTLLTLAYACAAEGEKTVFVDCDVAHSPFRSITQFKEVSPASLAKSPRRVSRFAVDSGFANLKILPVLATPSEQLQGMLSKTLLLTPKFERHLAQLTEEFDRVILDVPPLLEVPDAAILLGYAGSILQINRWNHTNRGSASGVTWALEELGLQADEVIASRVNIRKYKKYDASSSGMVVTASVS